MRQNSYAGFLEKWKSDLITARARRFGLRGHDLAEAQQVIALHIGRFTFDPARSNGASETTALTALIDRQLKSLHRARSRYTHRVGARISRALLASVSYEERHELILDVQNALNRLTPDEQSVCRGLAHGNSIARIAHDLTFSWHKVRRIIAHVRARFATLGLDGWLTTH